MKLQQLIRRTALAALAVSAASAPVRAAGWWNPRWPYRRAVDVAKFKTSRLPDTDVAVVTMLTGGLMMRDGRDVRVTSSAGREVPFRVLMVGPGDQVKIALSVRGGARRYYVYFGNRKAKPAPAMTIRRGVLLEMWHNPGGPTATLEQVQAVLAKADRLIGRGFRRRVHQGHNPFGPQSRIACIYTGYLVCPKAGAYGFATSSQNASFLLIDDKLVVENGGSHAPQRDIRKRGTVKLRPGLHKLTFYHVSGRGDPYATVAWREPGAGRFLTIPASAFAPIIPASPGPMQKYGSTRTISFVVSQIGEAFMMNRYYQRYRFRALADTRITRGIEWTWDFGDGQTAAGPEVTHIYLTPGPRTVSLTAKTPAGRLVRTNRIYVSRPWDRVTSYRIDSLKEYSKAIGGYDFAKLDVAANAEAVLLLHRAWPGDALLWAGAAFAARPAAPGRTVEQILPIYADALVAGGKAQQAVDALLKGVKMTDSVSTHVALTVRAGRVLIDQLGQPDAAMKLFDRVVRKYAAMTSSGGIRDARIGLGDAWRAKGDYEKAAAAYNAARERLDFLSGRTPIKKGDHARYVEDYLRRNLLDDAQRRLDAWERSFPADKLEGYSTLMRVRLLLARREYAAAVAEAEVLVRVNPGSNYGAELLLKASEAYRKLGKVAEATAALKLIVSKYPESPLSQQAAERLKR